MQLGQATIQALNMIASGDKELYFIAYNSLYIAVVSTAVASLVGLPIAALLVLQNFPGKRLIVMVCNSLMSLPTVVVGLLVYSMISRMGPLGHLGLLFTPNGIIIGQSILILPIVVSLVYGGLTSLETELSETLITLGANRWQRICKIVFEGRVAVTIALLSAFGRVIGEVGVSMMLGGNIRWYTRTMTTAMALETSRGAFDLSLALGLVLMVIAFAVNFMLYRMVSHAR
jgi:tungstate transport system permease protein